MDKIHTCIDLLCEYGYAERKPTLKETYENLIGIYNLERDNKEMWKMVWNHDIQSLFQMEKQSGIQGIALTKPESVDDLATLNSVIRLMAQEKGAEQPLNKYARFKKDISLWYKEMRDYGLTPEEQKLLEPILKISYGMCESQERFMQLVQLPECGGFSLTWADGLRKAIAKKNPEAYMELEQEYFKETNNKNLSQNLCNYVWNVLVATSRGYGFNLSHTLAYSLIALQEMNLAFKYPIIFWNCACLITDSGGTEEIDSEGKTNNYDKIATAIGKMRAAGIQIEPPDINNSVYTFSPDVDNNKILFGLRGLVNVGTEIIDQIILNRPYASIKDFYLRVKPKKQSMITLIKAGAFDNLIDRKLAMAWYLWETCDKKQRVTLQNMSSLIRYNLLPEDSQILQAKRVYEFNRYLKAITKADPARYDGLYTLDTRALNFLNEIECEHLIQTDNLAWFIDIKKWDKVYQKYMDDIRSWLSNNKTQILEDLNTVIFKEAWDKYAAGSLSKWEMDSLCYYHHEHELSKVNYNKYGLVDFNDLSKIPQIDKSFNKGGKTINMYKLKKICGTCIAKDKNKSTVSILTTSGVVEIKMHKEYFSIFDKQISEKQPDGTKKVIEKSWFNRGNMILVQGIRQGDQFFPKKYASSGGHQLYKIIGIEDNGDLILQTERAKGEADEEEI